MNAETPDEWDAKAAELLPCIHGFDLHGPAIDCPASYRPAVAAELRAQEQKRQELSDAALKASLDALSEIEAQAKEIERLKAMNQELWAALIPEKRHELNKSLLFS